jgi:hypothetical protein
MKRKFFTSLFVIAFLITNFQCTKEQFCKNKALCDLFSNTILPTVGVLVGIDLTIVSAVYNSAASNVDCTEDAANSNSSFEVDYRVDANVTWKAIQNVSNQVLKVESLVAGGNPYKTGVKLLFNQAGQYRFKTGADYDLKVKEREETNNGSCAGCLLIMPPSNNVSYSEILTVYENPNRKFDPSKPQVEILSIKEIK